MIYYQEKLRRAELYRKADNDINLQQALKKRCELDILYWFDNFCWTWTRETGDDGEFKVEPFILYDFQRKAVKEIWDSIIAGRKEIYEKSRDLGLSWIFGLVFQYGWQFYKHEYLVLSMTESDLERIGDYKTFFPKIKLNLARQPKWLLPEFFNIKKHVSMLKILNPHRPDSDGGNSIIGLPSTSQAGVGARANAVLFDEAAYYPNLLAVYSGCTQTARCIFLLSTPSKLEGKRVNQFARLRFGFDGILIPVKSYYWYVHPNRIQNLRRDENGEYTSDWLEEQKKDLPPQYIESELKINYDKAVTSRVFNEFNAIHKKKGLQFNPHIPICIVFDFGKTNCVLWVQIDNFGKWKILRESLLENSNTEEQIAVAQNFNDSIYSESSFKYTCDPSGSWEDHRGNDTDVIKLNNNGIHPVFNKIVEHPNVVRKKRGIDIIKAKLQTFTSGTPDFLVDESCLVTIEAFESGYVYDRLKDGTEKDTIKEVHPYEDVIDCLIYIALQFSDTQMRDKNKQKPRRPKASMNPYT